MLDWIIIALVVYLMLGFILLNMSIISVALSALCKLADRDPYEDELAHRIEESEKLIKGIDETLTESRTLRNDPKPRIKLPG